MKDYVVPVMEELLRFSEDELSCLEIIVFDPDDQKHYYAFLKKIDHIREVVQIKELSPFLEYELSFEEFLKNVKVLL